MSDNYSLIIKNGFCYIEGQLVKIDLGLLGNKIKKVGKIELNSSKVFDATDKVILPGIIDTQVHFREPGSTDAEDLESGSRRTIEVFNKIDKLDSEQRYVYESLADKSDGIVALSSLTGENITQLLTAIDSALAVAKEIVTLSIPQVNGAAISWLYDNSNVIERSDMEELAKMRVQISPDQLARFQKFYIC